MGKSCCPVCEALPWHSISYIAKMLGDGREHISNADSHIDIRFSETGCEHCALFTCDFCIPKGFGIQLALIERMLHNRDPLLRISFSPSSDMKERISYIVEKNISRSPHTGEYMCGCANCLFDSLLLSFIHKRSPRPKPILNEPIVKVSPSHNRLPRCASKAQKMKERKMKAKEGMFRKTGTRSKRKSVCVTKSLRNFPLS